MKVSSALVDISTSSSFTLKSRLSHFAFRSLALSTEHCFEKSLTLYLRYSHLISEFLRLLAKFWNFNFHKFSEYFFLGE